MKKLLYCAAALAVAFFAGSCQQEKLEPVQESNAVTFTVEAPAALQTRAIADGLNVNELVYEVWLTETLGDLTQNAQRLYQAKTDMAVENGVNKATITLDLVNDQKFTVLFWAQVKEEGAYNTDKLTAVTYAKSEYNANNESLAAFYAVAYVDDCQHVKKDGSATGSQVTLYRPFAQLNLGTLNTSTAYTVALVSSEVNVKNVNTVFNVATSVASDPEEMTFKMAAVPTDPATLAVNGASYEYAGMNYMFAGDNVTVEYDIVTSLNRGMTGTVNNIVDAVPLKENYRTNIVGNLLTSKVDYEIVVDAEFNTPDEIITEGVDYVTTDLELNAALKQDKRDIVIDLAQEEVTRATAPKTYNVDVDAWKTLAFGSEQTKSITINANGNTINFNLKNSDWSHVSLNNDDAVLTINDANITTSGYNTDHWKRVILHFASDVVLNNVTAANGLGFKKDAVLNDVEVSQVGDNYALWVWAQGQTVTLDGVSVDSPGRALKVADEDADGPEKVTINVTNSTFKSAKKAAILVTSKAGALINWGRGNDITGVAADPANAVWVDDGEKYQNIEDVTVTGASVIIEGQVSSTPVVTNAEELKAAIAAANNDKQTVILLKAGTYTGAFDIDSKNVALIGEDGVVIDGLVHGLHFAHILLRNITLTNATPATSESARHNADNYCLGAYVTDFVIEDCVFNVNNTGAAAGKGAINIYANRSDYKTSEIDGVQYDLVIRNTTFNCNGERPIRGKTNSYIEGCTFNDQHRYAIQVQGNSGLATETVTFINNKIVNPCATSGEAFAAGVSISKSQLLEDAAFNIYGNTLESTTFEDLKFVYDISDNVQITTCTLNGKQIAAGRCVSIPGVTDAKEVVMDYTDGLAYAVTNADLLAALKDGATHIYLYPGNYEFAENPAIAADNVVIEGADKEACVLKISKQLRADNKSLTLKNLTTDVPAGLAYTEHTFAWIHYFKEFNMIDCNSNGRIRLNSYSANIEGCNFDVTTSNGFDGYGIYYYGPKDSNVKVKNCVFTTAGKAIVMYNEGDPVLNLDVEECTFTSSATTDKAAIQMHTEYGISGTLDITKCTATGFADVNGGLWNELNNNTKVPTYNFTITVDGETVQEAGWAKVNEGVYNKENEYKLTNATGLFWFANELNVNGNTFAGKTVKLTTDIDLENAAWTPVGQTGATQFKGTFDGQNFTISNLNVDATAQTGEHYSSGLFGWLNAAVVKNVKVYGATVKGNHNVGVIGGYLETSGCTIENCHVTNAAVECHVANSEANGDKCGVIVGHAGNDGVVVKNCTAAESTVSAGRDAGQIVGAAKEANVTGCSATNVTVTANGEGNGTNIRNEVIGRIL